MNSYETLFTIKPTLTEEEINSQIEKVETIISKNGGDIKLVNRMGMRRLAYPINKQGRGFYVVAYYKSPADLINELEYQLRYNEDILRFMTVRYVTKKEIAEFDKIVKANSKEEQQTQKEESSSDTNTKES